MSEQAIHQRTAVVTGTRVNNQTNRLVQYDDVLVLVEYVQRKMLGTPFHPIVILGSQHQPSPGNTTRLGHLAIAPQTTRLDPFGKPATREISKNCGGGSIEAVPWSASVTSTNIDSDSLKTSSSKRCDSRTGALHCDPKCTTVDDRSWPLVAHFHTPSCSQCSCSCQGVPGLVETMKN